MEQCGYSSRHAPARWDIRNTPQLSETFRSSTRNRCGLACCCCRVLRSVAERRTGYSVNVVVAFNEFHYNGRARVLRVCAPRRAPCERPLSAQHLNAACSLFTIAKFNHTSARSIHTARPHMSITTRIYAIKLMSRIIGNSHCLFQASLEERT